MIIIERSILWLVKHQRYFGYPQLPWPGGKGRDLKKRFREHTLDLWQKRWTDHKFGNWTKKLIPSIRHQLQIHHLDFFLGQALTSHGCFRHYLRQQKRCDSASCPCGEPDETAAHVFYECPRFTNDRPAGLRDETIDIHNPDHLRFMRITVRRLWDYEQRKQGHRGLPASRL